MRIDRRRFNLGLAGTFAVPASAHAAPARRLALYSGTGDTLTHYDVDVDAGTLTRRGTLQLPSTLQYAWPHPSGDFLYATTSDAIGGSREITGKVHRLCAIRIAGDGTLALHGEPQALDQRPIHNSVDRTGRYVLTCYNVMPDATVHPINLDGTLGAAIVQRTPPAPGFFPHQIRTTPTNRTAIIVTRGTNAENGRPETPGALDVYRFDRGQLTPIQKVTAGRVGGLGYGPRHIDFHPSRPWAYVAVERQNELHMHRLRGDAIDPVPAFVLPTTGQDAPGLHQVAGAIHVHPRGHVVYVSNRASGTVDHAGRAVFAGGDNSIAVFAIDARTGEPRLIQRVDPQGFHVRAFAIDPSGRLLVSATMIPMAVRDGDGIRDVPARLSLFRIALDGTLRFLRTYDVALAPKAQQVWVGMIGA